MALKYLMIKSGREEDWTSFIGNFFRRITELVRPKLSRHDHRGCPLSPERNVLLLLDILGGAHFMRTQGVLAGCCITAVFKKLYE